MIRAVLVALWAVSVAGVAQAACPPESEMQARAERFLAEEPLAPLAGDLTMDDALCAQSAYVAALSETLGAPKGFKVGFASRAAQEAFGISEPARGVLLEGMLLQSGARVPAARGVRSLYEADLLIRVKDEGINEARTAEEAIAHIDAVIPFIELPDIMYPPEVPLTGPLLVAANMGARAGVMGPPIRALPTATFMSALRNMKVIMSDDTGATLTEGTGRALLDDPMNVVLWLIGDLRRTGDRLAAGDVISLGALGPPLPPEPGRTVTVTYIGISDRPQTVRVTFE